MTTNNYNIEELKAELERLEAMTEEEACQEYQVERKEDAVVYIEEYWTCLA